MKLVTLVRHGQSEANVTGHWQGHGDSPLSAAGELQAKELAARLARETWRFDRVVSSDLSRAAATADACAATLGTSVSRDPVYREIDVGEWEGLARAEVKDRFPDQIASLQRGEDVAIGGGESWAQLARRAEKAIQVLQRSLEEGQHAAIFAHGGFIASAVAHMCGIERRKRTRLGHMSNTSVTTLAFEGQRVRLVRFNDTAHVAPLGDWGEERRASGATVVSLLSAEHGWYERAHEYVLGEGGLVPELRPALAAIHQRHPGARVSLRVSPEQQPSFAEEVLQSRGILGPPSGVSHVVVEGDHHALADYNVGGGAL